MTEMIDQFGRKMNYLRIAVTDRCNLRCTYCMPSENMNFLPKEELLSYDELYYLINTFHELGVKKIRFTGGEPFVRKGFMTFLKNIRLSFPDIRLHITTNGIATPPFIDELTKLDINGINISLDTLNAEKFLSITKRDELNTVLQTIHSFLDSSIPVKINSVVQPGVNEDEILPMIDYFKSTPAHLRFIEFMPFNEKPDHELLWNGERIIQTIKEKYSTLIKVPSKRNSTSFNYKLSETSEFEFGVIEGFTRSFCSTCNRIRLTSTGLLKTCLYADPATDLKSLIRNEMGSEELKAHIYSIVTNRFENGKIAQSHKNTELFESMSKIGG